MAPQVRLAAAFRLFREADFTRPYVTILAGPPGKPADIGTGTFIEKDWVKLLSCQHVASYSRMACGASAQVALIVHECQLRRA
jgi:hypothetical protein